MGVKEPRLLTQQHIQALGKQDSGKKKDRESLDSLDTNQMKLYSYYKPSLKAGAYQIEARQDVTIPDGQSGAGKYYIYNGNRESKPATVMPKSARPCQ